MIPSYLLSRQNKKSCLIVLDCEVWKLDPVGFSVFVHLMNGQGHTTVFVTHDEEMTEDQVTGKLYHVPKNMDKRAFLLELNYKPDIWIGG